MKFLLELLFKGKYRPQILVSGREKKKKKKKRVLKKWLRNAAIHASQSQEQGYEEE